MAERRPGCLVQNSFCGHDGRCVPRSISASAVLRLANPYCPATARASYSRPHPIIASSSAARSAGCISPRPLGACSIGEKPTVARRCQLGQCDRAWHLFGMAAFNPYRGFRYPAEVIQHAVWSCCMDLGCGRSYPSPAGGQAMRTEIGRPSSSIRVATRDHLRLDARSSSVPAQNL